MKKLTREELASMEPCGCDYSWWCENCEGLETKEQLVKSFEHRFDWGACLSTKLMNRKQCLELAIYSAELVLPVFENRYPDDKRPRLAIESADAVLKNSDMESREKAFCAAFRAANAAADAAEAASSAANAADAAANAAANAADAADAADAVADAAEADVSAKQKIINKAIELFEEI